MAAKEHREVLLALERGSQGETAASREGGHRFTPSQEKSARQHEAAGICGQRTTDHMKDPQLQEARTVHLGKD